MFKRVGKCVSVAAAVIVMSLLGLQAVVAAVNSGDCKNVDYPYAMPAWEEGEAAEHYWARNAKDAQRAHDWHVASCERNRAKRLMPW